jgi:hypothetical protein
MSRPQVLICVDVNLMGETELLAQGKRECKLEAIKANHTYHAVPMPFSCHAVPLRV